MDIYNEYYAKPKENMHILSVLVQNHAGVLQRITGLFSRKGYNIQSLSAAQTEDAEISRITIVVYGDSRTLDQVFKQLKKLVEIREVKLITNDNAVCREHILIKMANNPESRSDILEAANLFDAKILDVSESSLIIELTGEQRKISGFINLISPYGIKQLAKTGVSALERGDNCE